MFFAVFAIIIGFNLCEDIAKATGVAVATGIYKVKLSETVDTNQFQELYDIVDYEDGVYYIKIKE